MKYTRLLLAAAAGTALILIARKIRSSRDERQQSPYESELLPFIPGLTFAQLEDLDKLLPDNPVHNPDDHLFI